MAGATEYKVKEVTRGSPAGAYRALMYGDMSLGRVIWAEILFTLFGGLGGALGLYLRMKLYPALFKSCGRKVVFGKNITIRHPHKIVLGDGVVLDDGCMVIVDAVDEEGTTCRTKADAPEIDGNLYIDEGFDGLAAGDIVWVEVDEAGEYDLWGRLV